MNEKKKLVLPKEEVTLALGKLIRGAEMTAVQVSDGDMEYTFDTLAGDIRVLVPQEAMRRLFMAIGKTADDLVEE